MAEMVKGFHIDTGVQELLTKFHISTHIQKLLTQFHIDTGVQEMVKINMNAILGLIGQLLSYISS